jgi:hypothetical protein
MKYIKNKMMEAYRAIGKEIETAARKKKASSSENLDPSLWERIQQNWNNFLKVYNNED